MPPTTSSLETDWDYSHSGRMGSNKKARKQMKRVRKGKGEKVKKNYKIK